MKIRAVLLFALCLEMSAALGQNTTITASHIQVFGGTAVTGSFCVTPTDQNGYAINLVTSTGQLFAPATPKCFPISAGVLSSTAIVPDTSLTQPVHACYVATIKDTFGNLLAKYPCIQPQGSIWSFDGYVPTTLPSIPALAMPQYQTNGTPNQNQGLLNIACSGCTNSGGTVNIPLGSGTFALASGLVNQLAVSLPGIVANQGTVIKILPNLSNTSTAPTLAINGNAAVTITKFGQSPLAPGDITITAIAQLLFDGTYWQLQNPQTTSSVNGALLAANNLADLANASIARTNVGLGSVATHAATDFDAAGAASVVQAGSLQAAANLGDLANVSQALINLGIGSAGTQPISAFDPANAAANAQAASLPLAGSAAGLAQAAGTCSAQVYTAGSTIAQYTTVGLSAGLAVPSGISGGGITGVAQNSAASGYPVSVCFSGPSSVVMDSTTTQGNLAITSTVNAGHGLDSGTTSRNAIGLQVGVLGTVMAGCTGAPCTAVVSLEGMNRTGRQITNGQVLTALGNGHATAPGTGAAISFYDTGTVSLTASQAGTALGTGNGYVGEHWLVGCNAAVNTAQAGASVSVTISWPDPQSTTTLASQMLISSMSLASKPTSQGGTTYIQLDGTSPTPMQYTATYAGTTGGTYTVACTALQVR